MIGREFPYQLLAPIADEARTISRVALGRLADAGLVFCRGTPPAATYLFKHTLVRDAAYASLLRRRREELHARIAAVLVTEFPEIVAAPSPSSSPITSRRRVLPSRPCAYWQRAGERAVARSANLEAVAHLSRGIEVLKTLPESAARDERELVLQVASIAPVLGRPGVRIPEAERAATRALELSRR